MITKNTSESEVLKLGKICKQCGKCCSFNAGFAQIDELKKIADHLKISEEKLKEKYFDKANVFNKEVYRPKLSKKDGMPFGPCIFLENNACSIHEVKPLHCRVGNCSKDGEALSEWYSVNYLVDAKDSESIRQWALRIKLKPTIKGGTPLEIVGDKKKLQEILEYKII